MSSSGQPRIKVGIVFGGVSREREISFAGGRTVYDNLDKSLFEAIPLFIDSLGQWIVLDWKYIYKGTIRDFCPPDSPETRSGTQLYLEHLNPTEAEHQALASKLGRPIAMHELPALIDVAFLALHGRFGEDGQVQSLLDQLGVPYTGSGVLPSALGMHKGVQKTLMADLPFATKPFYRCNRSAWLSGQKVDWQQELASIGWPLVVRPSNQGSSIGVSILREWDPQAWRAAMDKAFFVLRWTPSAWRVLNGEERKAWIRAECDIRSGIGLPVRLNGRVIYHPDQLLADLDALAKTSDEEMLLEAVDGECEALIEGFIQGREFSCIVIRNEDGRPLALPPTEILKGEEVYDYRSKYLAGLSRKQTPIELPEADIERIRAQCERLYGTLGFHVYARIDGFITDDGTIYLNDPNTTSGMLPSSFFFHQAAEIGLSPGQFLTFIIHSSLYERWQQDTQLRPIHRLIERLEHALRQQQQATNTRQRVAVLLGGYSSERHISVESGRNIFEKLSASPDYDPFPVFVGRNAGAIGLWKIPIRLMLKDNADDIRDKLDQAETHPVLERIRAAAAPITKRIAGGEQGWHAEAISFEQLAADCDFAFIGLHGRPGEDGELQTELEKWSIPYNGSRPDSARITIDKAQTNEVLRAAGLPMTSQQLLTRQEWDMMQSQPGVLLHESLQYPFIAKPVDDGCSSAVKQIRNPEMLSAFLTLIFRENVELDEASAKTLGLKLREEFPQKEVALLEALISPDGASRFMEITCGMMTTYDESGALNYLVFEPSEVLAGEEVLSLEEKFLAGEGQNITPARFAGSGYSYDHVAAQVKADLERAARAAQVEGYCRIDAFVRIFNDGRAETVVIEINSLPGMTPATCIFHQAAIAGYKPAEFIGSLIAFGIERNKAKIC